MTSPVNAQSPNRGTFLSAAIAASGVAVALELARLMATRRFAATVVFAAVAGEEQGLYGSTYMAKQLKAQGADVQGMVTNDIIGSPAPGAAPSTGTPSGCSPRACRLPRRPSRPPSGARWAVRTTRPLVSSPGSCARSPTTVPPASTCGGSTAAAAVARVNGAALWSLATAPGTPRGAAIRTNRLTNETDLIWDRGTDVGLAGYEVVYRESTAPEWEHAVRVGDVTAVTLDISKDNVSFGVRAIDRSGRHSPAAFPVPAP